MRLRWLAASAVLSPLFLCASALSAQVTRHEAPLTSPEERAALHRSSEWAVIEPHLPDPNTASPAQLEIAAD